MKIIQILIISLVMSLILVLPSQGAFKYSYSYGDKVIPNHDGGSYWEGVVVDRADGRYKVKITNVTLKGWLTLGIGASECTGNEHLDNSSVGEYIWVPKSCVE